MKKTSFIVALIAMLFSFTGAKADSYSDALTKMIQSGVVQAMNMDQLKEQMQQTGMTPEGYFDGKFITDIIDVLVPYYRENMTEAEMAQLSEFYTNPKILEATKNIVSASSSMQSSMMNDLQPAMMQLMQGQQPPAVTAKDVDADYKKVFDRYLEVSNAKENIKNTFASLKGILGQMGQGADAAQMEMMENLFNSLGQYMGDNIGAVTLNTFYGKVSIDDIKEFNKIADQPFYNSYMNTITAITKDVMGLSMKLIQKMGEQ